MLPPVKARQPLRERCPIQLTVQTSSEHSSRRSVSTDSQVTPPRVYPEWTNFFHYDAPFDHLSRCYHLQELIEGLYVAFADTDQVDTLCLEAGVPFTHVVRIETVEDPMMFGSRSEEMMSGVCNAQKLTFKCPTWRRDIGYTALSSTQLLAARDYLSLTMPYTGDSSPKIHAPSFDVKLLLVAPAECAVDMMSVVTCYLAFSSGHHAETVMKYIGEEEYYDEVWKESISRDGLEFVERIARVM